MTNTQFASPDEVEYIEEGLTGEVFAEALTILTAFQSLSHDMTMAGMALHLAFNELVDWYPETLPDDIARDYDRQVATHLVATLASAVRGLLQALATAEGAQQDSKIVGADGKPLRLDR